MITEDYVSFETAKLLKEKGFDIYGYASIKVFGGNTYEVNGEWITPKEDIIIPTLQMAMKWLREVHHWHIFVIPRWEDVEYMPGEWEEKMVGYQYVIVNIGEVARRNEQPTTTALSAESACEAAIKYCLENLI